MTANFKDPYRTLGLSRGATEEEVKRAYRALAKRHHPDAGKGSVARFLEIQAAYETLLGGPPHGGPARRPNSWRPARPGPAGARGPAGGPSTEGADAGPGAAPGFEWARRGRARGGAPAGPATGGGGRPGEDGGRHAGRGDESAPRGAGSGRRRHYSRKRATLGSTSYDEVHDVHEPEWDGASWYGPTSGTYWTINPREYADPRKHGPEYLARTRRGSVAGDRPPDADRNESPAAAASANEESGQAPPPRAHQASGHRSATGAGARAWRPASAAPADGPESVPSAANRPESVPSAANRRPGASGPGLLGRGALAVLGWFAPALALAAWAGIPDGLLATLPLQVAGLALLAARPRLAWAGLGGGMALAVTAIPIVAVLAALGYSIAPGSPAPASAVVLAALAWSAGAMLFSSGRLAPYPWREIP